MDGWLAQIGIHKMIQTQRLLYSWRQFSRYAATGMLTNSLGYLLYLLITWIGIHPLFAMTTLYGLGVALSFILNRRWAFNNNGCMQNQLYRYLISHSIGYLLNLTLLSIFVQILGFPHELVQAAAVLIVAVLLYLLLRFYVFAHDLKPLQSDKAY